MDDQFKSPGEVVRKDKSLIDILLAVLTGKHNTGAGAPMLGGVGGNSPTSYVDAMIGRNNMGGEM